MERIFWKNKILDLLKERTILWLAGVRRSGKTTLVRALPGSIYLDCELPRVRALLDDFEFFFKQQEKESVIILDEIHRLVNPSQILKQGDRIKIALT